MLTLGRVGYASSLAWRSAFAVFFLVAAVPAEAGDGNWNGFYAGLNAGGAWGSSDTGIGCVDNTGFNVCTLAAAENPFPVYFSNDLDGFIGGVQAGYNLQSGKMVFGIEADIAWTSMAANTSVSSGSTTNFEPSVVRVYQDLEYLATLRGRLGYAVHNNMLVYATGGLAFGDVNHSYALNFPSLGDYARASDSKTQTGWTVGGGGEYSLGRWSLKAEYLYYDLGEESYRAQAVEVTPAIGPGGPIDLFFTPEYETKGHIIRAGLNFKFGSRSRQPVPLK